MADADTQANFTSSFLDPAQTVPGVERLFHPAAEQNPLLLVRRTHYPWIDVLPSSAALARFDLADQREWERADLHLSLVESIRELRPLYDYVLIDCPPRLSLVSFAALCALTSPPGKADVHGRLSLVGFAALCASDGGIMLVTGETNFHTCLETLATEIALLLPGHYASERFLKLRCFRFPEGINRLVGGKRSANSGETRKRTDLSRRDGSST